jgi:hypothetical protein
MVKAAGVEAIASTIGLTSSGRITRLPPLRSFLPPGVPEWISILLLIAILAGFTRRGDGHLCSAWLKCGVIQKCANPVRPAVLDGFRRAPARKCDYTLKGFKEPVALYAA